MDCHVVELETECVPKRTCRNETQEAPKTQRGSKVLPEINASQVRGIGPELTYFSISQYKR